MSRGSRTRTFSRRRSPAQRPKVMAVASTPFEAFAAPALDGPTRLETLATLMRMARRGRPAASFAVLKKKNDADRAAMLARWAAQGLALPADAPAQVKPSPRALADEAVRRARERNDATKPRPRAPIRTDGVDRPDAPQHGDGPLDPARRTQARRESARRESFPPPSIVAGAHAWADSRGHVLVDNTENAQRELAKLRARFQPV